METIFQEWFLGELSRRLRGRRQTFGTVSLSILVCVLRNIFPTISRCGIEEAKCDSTPAKSVTSLAHLDSFSLQGIIIEKKRNLEKKGMEIPLEERVTAIWWG